MADGDFRVKCACPRLEARDCYDTRHPQPFDDMFRNDPDENARCCSSWHEEREAWFRDIEEDELKADEG